MFLETRRTIAFVYKPRGGCLCQGRRSLTWNRSSGFAGAGLAIQTKGLLVEEGVVLAVWEATSSRMAWTTEERLSRDGWRATQGKEALEDFGRLTAPFTAFCRPLRGPHLCMSEQVISYGIINQAQSKAFRWMISLQRAAPLLAPQGKRRKTPTRKMLKTALWNLQRWRPERGMHLNACWEKWACRVWWLVDV